MRNSCVNDETVIPVACDETVIIHLIPRPCPASTSTHKPALDYKNTTKIIRGVTVVLEEVATDRCGNTSAAAVFDPTEEPQASPSCEQTKCVPSLPGICCGVDGKSCCSVNPLCGATCCPTSMSPQTPVSCPLPFVNCPEPL